MRSQPGSDVIFSGTSSTTAQGGKIESYSWQLLTFDKGFVVASGSDETLRVPQMSGWYIVSLQVTDDMGFVSQTETLIGHLTSVAPPPLPVGSITDLSPLTMTANGVSKQLTIIGTDFSQGNIVQYRWSAGSGAGAWTNSSGATSVLNGSQITVPLNPGTVSDNFQVRVCRSYQQNTDADCSSGVWAVVVTSTLPVGPDLVPQIFRTPATSPLRLVVKAGENAPLALPLIDPKRMVRRANYDHE